MVHNYTPPDGFVLDPNSGLYYRDELPGTDPRSAAQQKSGLRRF